MDRKDKLADAAFQQFDECVDKHMKKIKNFLNGIIFHSYEEGVRDGKRSAWNDAQTVEFALDTLKEHGWKQERSCDMCPFLRSVDPLDWLHYEQAMNTVTDKTYTFRVDENGDLHRKESKK